MRLIPLLTAIAVTVGLYFLVFERDDLFAFARGETVNDDAAQGASAPDAATQVAVAEVGTTKRIGVVAIHSEARPLDSAVILRGQTQASRQVEVRAETTSTVISEPLRKGAQVKAGDLLCELDLARRGRAEAQAMSGRFVHCFEHRRMGVTQDRRVGRDRSVTQRCRSSAAGCRARRGRRRGHRQRPSG